MDGFVFRDRAWCDLINTWMDGVLAFSIYFFYISFYILLHKLYYLRHSLSCIDLSLFSNLLPMAA